MTADPTATAMATATASGTPRGASGTGPLARLGRRASRPGLVVLSAVAGVAGLALVVAGADPGAFDVAVRSAIERPVGLLVGLAAFAAAFVLRAVAWRLLLPELSFGQALAAIHLALGGNHVLPLRLGEPLRVVSVVRRARIDPTDATASTIALRSADVVALLVLGLLAGPSVVGDLLGLGGGVAVAVVGSVGTVAVALFARRRGRARLPALPVVALVLGAWLLEAVLVHEIAALFGVALSPTEAVVVLAAAIAGQLVAVAPGGVGTYEAAAAAGLAAAGIGPALGLAVALGLHGAKTAYSLVAGAVALVAPAPGMLGRFRLPAARPPRPAPLAVAVDAPVVLFLPALDEGPRVADVVARAPATVAGRPVVTVVVDDGSDDDTAVRAADAGAVVVRHDRNRGLGAAVRTGLRWATDHGAAAVAFCDADGEYDPAALPTMVAPVLGGAADYVAGSRFAGTIRSMRPHRRLGNLLLTRWVRWTVRAPVTDGQTGYRAFSPAAAAAATIPHDYNYAQVLTIDLLAAGFVYDEVGIDYSFRASGDSFVRLGRYVRRVGPTVWRQLNPHRTTVPG